MLNLDYPDITNLFHAYVAPKRTESASFLIWYLENYYRLDSLEAVDAICDQRGDKGVDGIYVNDNDFTIDIFQCKLHQKKNSTIGDNALKEFRGTLTQFESRDSIDNLIKAGGDADVVRLIKSLDLANKIETHEVRGVFISNIDLDSNAQAYLKTNSIITFVGRNKLNATYISEKRDAPISTAVEFDVSGFLISQYIVDIKTKALIAPVKARELVHLQGIDDQSLFAFNVRGPLGRTQVNKDIVKSIKDARTHKFFPLFHNGITIICESLTDTPDKILINNYYVVNGCQSLTSLYENQASITDDLRVLTKFIQMDVTSELSEKVTRYSNNQNGVKARDFKSNDPIQIRLQNEFHKFYKGQYSFEIKRGESHDLGEVISNENAGLYLMSFDLKEPWATHRKYQVFDDKHGDLFGRPEVSADRVVMCHVITKMIDELNEKINNKLFGKYALTKYVLLFMIRAVLESDVVGKQLIKKPEDFVRSQKQRQHFSGCIRKIIDDVIIDLNAEIDEYGDTFDYRGKLRDETWVKDLSKRVVASYLKLVQRKRIESFETEWKQGAP